MHEPGVHELEMLNISHFVPKMQYKITENTYTNLQTTSADMTLTGELFKF